MVSGDCRDSDRITLSKLKIKLGENIRYAGPQHLAHWLGWNTATIGKMLKEFPCTATARTFNDK